MNTSQLAQPVAECTMNELLEAFPGAAEVLAAHGVDPRTRCNVAVRGHLRVRKVLGRSCPVDDVEETLRDLRSMVGER